MVIIVADKEIEIKGLILREMVGSRGFIIPVQYMADRMTDGLKIGEKCDLIIKRSGDADVELL